MLRARLGLDSSGRRPGSSLGTCRGRALCLHRAMQDGLGLQGGRLGRPGELSSALHPGRGRTSSPASSIYPSVSGPSLRHGSRCWRSLTRTAPGVLGAAKAVACNARALQPAAMARGDVPDAVHFQVSAQGDAPAGRPFHSESGLPLLGGRHACAHPVSISRLAPTTCPSLHALSRGCMPKSSGNS